MASETVKRSIIEVTCFTALLAAAGDLHCLVVTGFGRVAIDNKQLNNEPEEVLVLRKSINICAL